MFISEEQVKIIALNIKDEIKSYIDKHHAEYMEFLINEKEKSKVINYSDLKLDSEKTVGKEFVLVQVKPDNYKDGQKTADIPAYKYVVACKGLRYEQMTVKIEGRQLLDVKGEQLDVEFQDLTVKVYENKYGERKLSGTATGIAKIRNADKTLKS